jgi:hypothetical protein
MRKLLSFAVLSISFIILGACSVPERGPGVPSTDTTRALPLGIPNARFYADGDPNPMIEEGARAVDREQAALRAEGNSATRLPPANFLAISGGGDNGAFGTGLLNGWAATGTRPEFKIVTGVSTGALIAPLSFLGPDYDDAMATMYTTLTRDKVYRLRGITAALFDDAMADTSPLAQVIASYTDQKMFDAIAREYQKGRLLLIGTTDLDAQRPVIWNVGAIAASGRPGSLELFRKINGQNNLGTMYEQGQGVLQDYVQAHVWYSLAASCLNASEKEARERAVKNRDAVAAKMTPAQLAEAHNLASAWKPKAEP